MDWIQAVVLGLVQGLTEFLPISSSAHLILVPKLFGWQDQSLAFDVALHFGTLLAVIGYFHRDIHLMTVAWVRSLTNGEPSGDARLAWGVLLATIPAGVSGFLLEEYVEAGQPDDPRLIAAALIGFGLLLWWAQVRARQNRMENALRWHEYLLIGVAQAVALIPGSSRSGVTMTAGLMLGLSRTGAARFSFLMALPVIVLATLYEFQQVATAPEPAPWAAIAAGTAAAAVSGFLCIHYLLKMITTVGFLPFVIYRLALGGLLLAIYL
ncbi:MAG: undecaprenyl-diphosphate phosphatase [Nevskiales bacterium]